MLVLGCQEVMELIKNSSLALPAEFTEWEGRIVGGHTANPGQFPFIASLRTNSNFHFCGGSIISDRWVVSAAHWSVPRITLRYDNQWFFTALSINLQLMFGKSFLVHI